MPAKTERQRRLFAMCAHHGGRHAKMHCPKMSTAQMREFSRKPKKGDK